VLAGGAFFTLLGVALAALLGRRIAAPIVALARSAARHGEGAAAAAASSVDEVRALERELTAASAARTQGEAEREQILAREQEARAAAEVARQRADVLAEVSRLLASPLDHDAALGSVARLLVPQLADLCAVDLVATTDGALQRVATVAADPDAAARTAALLVAAGDDDHPVARALASGRAELVTPGDGATAADVTALVVPLVARGRALGAISLVTTRAGRSYTRADVLLAEDIARRAAAAVDTARLFLQSETRRRAAEALAHAGRFLGEALDPSLVAERIATSARSLLGLATAVLYTVDPQTLEMRVVAASGDVRPGLERGSLLPAGAGTVGLAVRERRPVATADALHDPRLRIPPTLRTALERGPSRAVLAVPMLAQGQVVGVLALGDRGSRVFEEEEILFAQGFADQAALAVENARLLAEAQEASRAKDEFLATLSHELRTPLTAMLGWVRMLESGRLDDATVERAIQVIDRNTKLQAQLIDDLLDVSRIVTGKLTLDPRPVNLVGVIESALEAVDQGAQVKGVRLAARLDPSVGPVWGDAHRLQQVIWNLLSNAIKFTPAGGLVEVTLERADPCARVRVQDTGSGIKPEFLPHVFDRFRQGDGSSTRPHGGLGIGLALVRDLVGLHRGTVGGHSDGEGLGATFVVELPLMAVRVPDPAPAEGPVPSGPSIERFPVLTGVRVLVVDDDADARELLALVLEQSGAEVTCAASASEALDALARVRPSVLLSDLAMPDDDGYALVHKLRDLGLDRGGRVRAVAVSAYARDEDRARALAAGFETHVPKPVEPATLIALVARLAGREPT
jgi:signal transduction histidine kinase